MNPMQQMLAQAQRMQRELKKANEELDKKEFTASKSGMVTVTMTGNNKVAKIDIDKDAIDPDNAEMLSETIALAINECLEQIAAEREQIEERITGKANLPF